MQLGDPDIRELRQAALADLEHQMGVTEGFLEWRNAPELSVDVEVDLTVMDAQVQGQPLQRLAIRYLNQGNIAAIRFGDEGA